jgi:hypothetical protein
MLTIFAITWLASQAPAADRPLVLTGGTIVDLPAAGEKPVDVRDSVIVIRGGGIVAAGPRAAVPIPEGARVVPIEGAFVVPGLNDVFAGLNSQAQANAYLYMGVTSIVGSDEPGGRRGALFRQARPAPHVRPLGVVGRRRVEHVATPPTREDVLEQVEDAARQGAQVLLLYYHLTPEQTRLVVRRARDLRLATIGELGDTTYSQAIEAGVDAFVHSSRYGLELAPAGMRAAVARDPFGAPRTAFYEFLARLDPDAPSVGAWGRRLAASRAALIPTLSLYALGLPGHDNPWKEKVAAILDPKDIHLPADRETGEPPPSPGVPEGLSQSVVRIERRYRRAGARYLAGSGTSAFGTLPGVSLHNELKMLVDLGLSPREALAAATRSVGEAFRWPKVGLVKGGYDADLLVVDADPAADVRNLKMIRMVIQGGGIVDREALLKPPPPAR